MVFEDGKTGVVRQPLRKRRRQAKNVDGAGANGTVAVGGVKMYSNRWMTKVYEEKPPFPEDLFKTTFSQEKLETIVAALKLATDKEVKDSIRLLEDDYTYSVQITSHKVPHVPVHLSRVTLKQSLQNADSEICLFVKDLKRGRRLDFEPTIQHYEELLRTKQIKHNITIMPVNQLYNEYTSFELRRKLSFSFDKFLVDSAVAAHVNGFLGSKMLKKGHLAFPINVQADNLSDEIDLALRKVFYKHVGRGITQSIQVGKHSMSNDQIAENIIDLIRQFGDIHPGGYKNVYKLHLRPQMNISVSIPIYVSLDKPKDAVPVDAANKDKVVSAQAEKAAEVLENFDITAAAKLVQKRRATGFIVSEDILLSEDEKDDDDEPPKKQRQTEVISAPAVVKIEPAATVAPVKKAAVEAEAPKPVVSNASIARKAAVGKLNKARRGAVLNKPIAGGVVKRNPRLVNRNIDNGGPGNNGPAYNQRDNGQNFNANANFNARDNGPRNSNFNPSIGDFGRGPISLGNDDFTRRPSSNSDFNRGGYGGGSNLQQLGGGGGGGGFNGNGNKWGNNNSGNGSGYNNNYGGGFNNGQRFRN